MLLTELQLQTTRHELHAHFEDATLSLEALATQLETSPKEARDILNMNMSHMNETLFCKRLQSLIELLNNNITQNGGTPKPYTYIHQIKMT
ncbi:DUF2316 family protein [Staphylococcus hyicus]|uniref:DUF2316 family protein n=1 Tax=Staphylococcus hyicus TaxID=1284 RepID=UPI00211C9B7D|nr:DUF2316 family protein [Staphylococcus hyicus]MCQ9300813.1 DUF2316 family protein [Staphylococcus hyicus]MDP4449261.1 DUF2316 family protein [Staphylococcus hyicus]MDY3696918.1 DUF2316 family protein [Staphylococcus hyicus]